MHGATEVDVTEADDEREEESVEFVSEFCEMEIVEESLKKVKRDLETQLVRGVKKKTLDKELQDVVMECMTVSQDLVNGYQIETLDGEKQNEWRPKHRYSLRTRPPGGQGKESDGKEIGTECVRTRKETKKIPKRIDDRARRERHRLEKTESCSGTELEIAQAVVSKQRSCVIDELSSEAEDEEESDPDVDAQNSTHCSSTEQLRDADVSSSDSRHTRMQPGSLKQVISSLRSWQEGRGTPFVMPPSLPPLPDDIAQDIVQPRALHTNVNDQDTSEGLLGEASSGMKVYVMPSGYIVQSVQLVLERECSENENQTSVDLAPMFRPESYADTQSKDYIPLRRAPLAPSSVEFMDLDVRLNMVCTGPRTEAFDSCHVHSDINVTSFLRKLDERRNRSHPLPLPGHSSTVDELETSVKDMLLDIRGWRAKDAQQSDACLGAENRSPMTMEDMLRNFSQRIEKFYQAVT